MPGHARYRTQYSSSPCDGLYFNKYLTPPWRTRAGSNYANRTCSDVVGNFDGVNPLEIRTWTRMVPRLDGIYYDYLGNPYKQYDDCPITYQTDAPDPRAVYPDPDVLDQSNAAWEILAATNPLTPHVSVPTFIGELKDVPDLIHDWGGSLLRKVAKGHLSWRWAVKPMISDVRNMCSFVKAVDDRIKWLTWLRDKGYLSRRCALSRSTQTSISGLTYFESFLGAIAGYRRVKYIDHQWGSCRWKLHPDVELPRSDASIARLAHRLTFGLTSRELLSTAWELIPWSWFIDWFYGVGSVIAATHNELPMTGTQICLMRRTAAVTSYEYDPAYCSNWITVSGEATETNEYKQRFVVAPALPFEVASIAFLDARKWSVLTDLFVLRDPSLDNFIRHTNSKEKWYASERRKARRWRRRLSPKFGK